MSISTLFKRVVLDESNKPFSYTYETALLCFSCTCNLFSGITSFFSDEVMYNLSRSDIRG